MRFKRLGKGRYRYRRGVIEHRLRRRDGMEGWYWHQPGSYLKSFRTLRQLRAWLKEEVAAGRVPRKRRMSKSIKWDCAWKAICRQSLCRQQSNPDTRTRVAAIALMVSRCIAEFEEEINRVYPFGATVTFRYLHNGEVHSAQAVVSKHQCVAGEMPSEGLFVEVQEPELTRLKGVLVRGCALILPWDGIDSVQVQEVVD